VISAAQKIRQEMEKIVSDKIAQHANLSTDSVTDSGSEEQRDLLDILVSLKDEETGEPLAPQVIIDNCIAFLLAGHETSSTCLTWTIWLLITNPHVEEKLAREIRDELGANGIPKIETVDKLKYLNKVVKESLRIRPPVPYLGRWTEKDDVLCGHKIPAGNIVIVSPYVQHHLPSLWDEPEVFNPERWNEGSENIPMGAYIPFGHGARNCIGNRFALLEIKAILCMLIQKFKFSLAPGHPPIIRKDRIVLRPFPYLKIALQAR